MAEWTQTTWGDVAELRYGRALPGVRNEAGPTEVFGTNGPIGWTDAGPLFTGPRPVIGRKGAYRGVHLAAWKAWVIDTAYWLEPRENVDPVWAYHALRAADINGLGSGSAIPSTSREDFYALPVSVPSLPEQRAIAEVLGALDDKIAANTRILDTTLDVLDARYRLAIADDPRSVPLADVAQFHNRRRVPLSSRQRDARPGSVPYYGATGVFGFVDEPLFDDQLVLVGEDGSVINDDGSPVTQYIWGPSWVNNHAHVLTGSGISTELLYVALRRTNVATLVTGAVQPKISMGNLKTLDVRLPGTGGLLEIEARVAAHLAYFRSLTAQQRTLAATRDALLPALMSGKLRVRDAERTASEVL